MSQKVISFHYVLKNPKGEVMDQSEEAQPLTFLTGNQQIIPGLEKELVAMGGGETKEIVVPAAEAYGDRDDTLVGQVERSKFPEDLAVGQQYALDPSGQTVVTIMDFDQEMVTLDANHPLAGQDLHFNLEVTEVRDPTEEELSHGHAHGEGAAVQH